MRRLSRILRLLPILLAVGASGCGVTPGTPSAPQLYQLDYEVEPPDGDARSNKTILVERPHPAPGHDSSAIAYSTHEHQLSYYTESRWTESPARMLEPALVNALEGTGLFRAVISGTGTAGTDYRLRTDAVQVLHSFSAGSGSHVALRMRVQMIEQQQNRVLGTESIEVRVRASSDDAAGGVSAANEALAQAMQKVARFVQRQLSTDVGR